MSRLSRYQSTLKKWGLIENPFRPTPPDDPEKAGRLLKMKAALGCEGDHIDSTFLSDMEDIVDRAIALAPRLRSL